MKVSLLILCVFQESPSRGVGGGGRVGSPRGLSNATLTGLTILTVISLVYASCPSAPQVKIIVIIPPIVELGKFRV